MEPIKFVVKNTSIRNGRIDHVDIGDATVVDCTNCPLLTELPLWPNVTKVDCTNCPLLAELPLWPNVTEVWCSDCTSLTELPLWSNVTEVHSNLPVKSVYTLVDPNKTIYSSQSEKCCICMENPNEIIFNPCYHFDTCIKCAEQLKVVSSKCPICRTRIASLIKI